MAVESPFSGISWQALENLSMITRMQVFPLGAGKSVIKSTPRCDNERPGMGRGRSLPDGRWRGSLEIVHSSGNIGMIWRAPRWSTFTVGSFKDLLINNPTGWG